MPEIYILRLGHRPERDKRITTHVALTARALGAEYTSRRRQEPERSVRSVVRRFGGDFRSLRVKETSQNSRASVHLTMYGTHIDDACHELGTRPQIKCSS